MKNSLFFVTNNKNCANSIFTVGLVFAVLFMTWIKPAGAFACGPVIEDFKGYSFLNPRLVDLNHSTAPYFAGFEQVYRQLSTNDNLQQKSNLEEWQQRFCEIPRIEDIQYLVYQAPLTTLRVLKTAIQSKDIALSGRLSNNTFARYLQQYKCVETIDYLIFAKKCEPHVLAGNGWEAPRRDTVRMEFLIQDGLKAFDQTKSHYFKLRYAYQLVRLAHYKKNYRQTIQLYDYLIPKIDNDPSIIEDWVLGHKAGALMSLGKRVEASYLFSQIFYRSDGKRESAYRSFYIKTDEEWQACLRLCKNNEERATLYALRAQNPDSRAAEEIENIYDLDPQSPFLEQLLAREIQQLERHFLGADFDVKKRRSTTLPMERRLIAMQQTAGRICEENRIANLILWEIANGYLTLLRGDAYAAVKMLKQLRSQVATNELLTEQLEAMIMVAELDGIQEVNSEMENLVGDYQKSAIYGKYPDFAQFMEDKLTHLYKEQGYFGKAFLEQYSLNQLKYNPQLDVIEELIAVCQKEERTQLEEAMVLKKDGLTTIESDLWDLKGTYFLSRMQLEPALDAYRNMPRKDRDNYGLFNPFRENLNDCVNCRVIDTAAYNKVDILEQLLEWEYQARADMENGAAYYYQIGNALYNMTYYGHAWKVADYFRSGSSWYGLNSGKKVFPKIGTPDGNYEVVDCSLPLYYFNKSYQLSRNNELSARAAFMAAKCQQNMFYATKGSNYPVNTNQIPDVPYEFRQYFEILKSDFSQTDFYEKIIEECLYFERYVTKN